MGLWRSGGPLGPCPVASHAYPGCTSVHLSWTSWAVLVPSSGLDQQRLWRLQRGRQLGLFPRAYMPLNGWGTDRHTASLCSVILSGRVAEKGIRESQRELRRKGGLQNTLEELMEFRLVPFNRNIYASHKRWATYVILNCMVTALKKEKRSWWSSF